MSLTSTRKGAIRAATVVAGLLALAAHAADAPKAAPAKKAPVLTKEELRACMATKDRLAQQRDEVTQMQADLETEGQELRTTGEQLKEQLTTLDRTNAEAVEKHVEVNNAREKRIDAYEAKVGAYNAKVDALKTDKESYAKGCENRRFDEADEIAIKKGK